MGVPPSNRYGTGPTHAHCLHEPPVLFAVCCNLTTKFPQERIEQSHLLFIINILRYFSNICATIRIWSVFSANIPIPVFHTSGPSHVAASNCPNNLSTHYQQPDAGLSTENRPFIDKKRIRKQSSPAFRLRPERAPSGPDTNIREKERTAVKDRTEQVLRSRY